MGDYLQMAKRDRMMCFKDNMQIFQGKGFLLSFSHCGRNRNTLLISLEQSKHRIADGKSTLNEAKFVLLSGNVICNFFLGLSKNNPRRLLSRGYYSCTLYIVLELLENPVAKLMELRVPTSISPIISICDLPALLPTPQ